MGTYTTNLNLYNTDMDNDGNDLFDFDRDINANNNILDGAIGKPSTLTTTAKTSLVAAINEVVSNCGALTNLNTTAKNNLVAAINEILTNLASFASKDLDNLSTTGQGIIDAKIEAEALTAQNGYIKFKLNGISNPIIFQWLETKITAKSNTLTNLNQYMTSLELPVSLTTHGKSYISSASGSVMNPFCWNSLTHVSVGAVSRHNQDVSDTTHYIYVIGY